MPETNDSEIEITNVDAERQIQLVFPPSQQSDANGDTIKIKLRMPVGDYVMTLEGSMVSQIPTNELIITPFGGGNELLYKNELMRKFKSKPFSGSNNTYRFSKQEANVFSWRTTDLVLVFFKIRTDVFSIVNLSDSFAINLNKLCSEI